MTVNWGYIFQQGIMLLVVGIIIALLRFVLRAMGVRQQPSCLWLWLELITLSPLFYLLGRHCLGLGWGSLLPGRVLPFFVGVNLVFYWLAVIWPLRVFWNRRKSGSELARNITVGTAIIFVLGAIYACFVEPLLLDRDHRELRFEEIGRNPVRVAHISDLQLIDLGPRENSLVGAVNDFEPHIIVMSGDYICAQLSEETAIAAARSVISRLQASHGIYATTSDSETLEQRLMIFKGLDVHYLLNKSTVVEIEGVKVRIGGVNHYAPRWNRTCGKASDDELFIVACHTPDYAEETHARIPETDLYLCGHTHGGQVQIPWMGPIVTFTRKTPRHIAAGGLFETASGMPFAVSRGIGMEGNYAPRVRFNCRPHLFLLTLRGDKAR